MEQRAKYKNYRLFYVQPRILHRILYLSVILGAIAKTQREVQREVF